MDITSVIVETDTGMSGAVLHHLACLQNTTVFGFKDDKIIVVLESEDPDELKKMTDDLLAVEYVVSVSPVFTAHE
jgi:nitrate reductase NapAB chaperone NapD